MNKFELVVTPRQHGVSATNTTQLDVLVRIQAPDAPADAAQHRRHSLNLACVIDRSGSMAGPPLEEAKRCVAAMIESLKPTDRAACVVYDSRVDVLVHTTPVHDAGHFRTALASVTPGGATNLHGGWLAGAQQLAETLREQEIARVILLSDGNANAGLTNTDVIAAQCEALAGAGVSTSTYGLGHHFNEDLMIAMARNGGGNQYYGETAADLMEPFREEFELLQELCARQVRLRVVTPNGVTARVMNNYPLAAADTHRLPDVTYGAEAWALIRLTLPNGVLAPRADAERIPLVSLEVELMDTATRERRCLSTELSLPVVSDAVLNALPHDELVASRAQELDSADLHLRIRAAVRAGDWPTAERLQAQAELQAGSHSWLTQTARTLRDLLEARDSEGLTKETSYSSSRFRSRLAEKPGVSEQAWDPALETAKPSFLRRKPQQGRRLFDAGDDSKPSK